MNNNKSYKKEEVVIMKKKMMAAVLTMAMAVAAMAGCGSNIASNDAATTEKAAADGKVYKVGIVQYVDDASLNQIEKAIEAELDAKAKELGSDYIVVGRPITQAADPVAAYRRCVAEFVG